MLDIQIIILVGGLGTRLYPISKNIPKPLIKVCEKPFLSYLIDQINCMGFNNIILLSGYLSDQIDFFCKQYHPYIRNIKEITPLGTGGAIKSVLPILNDRFILFNGDTFLPGLISNNIIDVLGCDDQYIFSCERSLVDELPNLELGPNNKVISYGHSPKSRHVDSGVYIFNKKYFENHKKSDKFSLSEVYNRMIMDNKLYSIEINSKYYDIGTPERLITFENYIKGK